MSMTTKSLGPELLKKIDAYWRAANYEHNLAAESAIVLWNVVSNRISDLVPHLRVGDKGATTQTQ